MLLNFLIKYEVIGEGNYYQVCLSKEAYNMLKRTVVPILHHHHTSLYFVHIRQAICVNEKRIFFVVI